MSKILSKLNDDTSFISMKIYDSEMKVLESLIVIIPFNNTSTTIIIHLILYLFYAFLYALHKIK